MEHYALPVQVWGAGLVFARTGALVMVLPGIGESFVPPRIRLAFAFVFALLLYPVLARQLPPVPPQFGEAAGAVFAEVLIGLALGALLRLFLQALAVAGEIVSLQTTLSFAQTTNPAQAQPTATVATFLTLLGLTLIFSAGLHQSFIAGIARSYEVFAPGRSPPVRDLAATMVRTFGQTFALGVQLAAPVMVFSLLLNMATGLVARAMPQFQVFFAATPLAVMLGFSVLALSLGVFGLVWVDRFRTFADSLAGVG